MSNGPSTSAPPAVVTGPRFSFKGYSVVTWAAENAAWIKGFIGTEVAALSAQQWKAAGALAIGFAAKFLGDAVHYFVSVQTG